MSTERNVRFRILIALIAALIVGTETPVYTQQNHLDPTFNAVPSAPLTTPTNLAQVVQPDGKVIVFGPNLVVDGVAKGAILRLNADGTLDQGFHYCGCGMSSVVNLILAPNGKIIVAGADINNARMIRLNSDGSIDSTFLATYGGPPTFIGGADFSVNAVQPDGKVLATRRYSVMGNVSFTLERYNTDGSLDSGFTANSLAAGSPMSAYVRVELLADGRFYLAVTSGVTGINATLRRRNADGTADATWESPNFQTTGFPSATTIADIELTADGSLLVSGTWDTVNGINRRNLIKLQPPGNVDLDFTSTTVVQIGHGVESLTDGKILLSGRTDIAGINRIFRLNADGSPDNSFVMDPGVASIINTWVLDATGRIIFLGNAPGVRLVRLQPSGGLDGSFNPGLGYYGTVNALARQADAKVLVAGVYTHMNGTVRGGFARVNPDGTLDTSFDAGTGFNVPPSMMVLQTDGKILAVGEFGAYNGTPVTGLVRINTNGTIDNTFVVSTGSKPSSVSLQSDGKILISGTFASVNGTARTGVARLNSDGSLDLTFNPTIGSPSVARIVPLPDGKIMIAGSFSGVNGFNRSGLARLNSDGSLDQSFNATGVGSVGGLWIQADGKYLIGTGFNPTGLARRNSDGSVDPSFTPPSFSADSSAETRISAVVLLPDGSYLVGGRFDTAGTTRRRNLTRLAQNGALDILFMPSGANAHVRALIPDSPTKVYAGGEFSTIANASKPGVARLNIAPFRETTPFDFDGDGRADFTAYRPSTGVWYELSSGTNTYVDPQFGLSTDIVTPADFDGDGITDEAIWRPSTGDWWYRSSINDAQLARHYGAAGDIPRPGDFDGDGKADFIVFRPSTNQWFRTGSNVGEVPPFQFGAAGDIPVLGDFDGDGKADPAVFRPSTGDWWYAATSAGLQHRFIHWGATGDIPVAADYDGDNKTDIAIFRPSNGGWYIFRSSDQNYTIVGYGLAGDRPVPADYDGDGRADIAIFRPSTGAWWLNQSTAGSGGGNWGVATDVVAPNAFIPQ